MDLSFVAQSPTRVRIHDLAARRWVELPQLDCLIAQHMDGTQSIDNLFAFAQLHKPDVTRAELEKLVGQLFMLGLLEESSQLPANVIPFPPAESNDDGNALSEFSVLQRELLAEIEVGESPTWQYEDDGLGGGTDLVPISSSPDPRRASPPPIPFMPPPQQAFAPVEPAPMPTSTPEGVEQEQEQIWKQARGLRWYHKTWLRVVGVLVALVVIACLVPYPLYVTSNCVIIPTQRAYVRSSIEGIIGEILVDEGTRVKKGDVLARLDDRGLIADRQKVIADIARIEAELAQLRGGSRKEELDQQRAVVAARANDVKFARNELKRMSKMYKEGVAPRQALIAAKHEVETQEAASREANAAMRLLRSGSRPEQIDAKEADMKRAKAELAFVEQKLADMVVIRAPIDGVVLTTRFRERLNERVEAGGLVCEIADTASVRAEIFVPENEADTVKVGMPVTVKVESYPSLPFKGTVDFIAPRVEGMGKENASTIRVSINIENADGKLKQDMHGYGEIDCGKRSVAQLVTRRLMRWVRVRFLL